MKKTKLLDRNSKPLVTRTYHIEILVKAVITVEACSIMAAESIAAIENNYRLQEVTFADATPKDVPIMDIDIYQEPL
jgi:hypothetical protein